MSKVYLRVFTNMGFELIATRRERRLHLLLDPPAYLALPGETRLDTPTPELAVESVDYIIVTRVGRPQVQIAERLVSYTDHAELYIPHLAERYLNVKSRKKKTWDGVIDGEFWKLEELKQKGETREKQTRMARITRSIKNVISYSLKQTAEFFLGKTVLPVPLYLEVNGIRMYIQGRRWRKEEEIATFAQSLRSYFEEQSRNYLLLRPHQEDVYKNIHWFHEKKGRILVVDPRLQQCQKEKYALEERRSSAKRNEEKEEEEKRNTKSRQRKQKQKGEKRGEEKREEPRTDGRNELTIYRIPVNTWIDLDDELEI